MTGHLGRIGRIGRGRSGLAASGPSWTPDPTRAMFAATRLAVPVNSRTVSAGNENVVYNFKFATPRWTPTGMRFALPGYYHNDGSNGGLEFAASAFEVRLSIRIGSTWTPVTFNGGAASHSFTGSAPFHVWTDPVEGLAPNTVYDARVHTSAAIGAVLPTGATWHTEAGEGVEASASSLVSRLTDGVALTGNNIGASVSTYIPACAVATGWDGSPVVAIMGDSRLFGQGHEGRYMDARGNAGYAEMMLDSAIYGTRLAYGQLSVPGLRAGQNNVATFRSRFFAMIEDAAVFGAGASYKRPFTVIYSNLIINDCSTTVGQSRGYATIKTEIVAYCNFLKGRYPGCKIIYDLPWNRTSQANNSQWATGAAGDQVPVSNDVIAGGTLDQFAAEVIGGTFGTQIDGYTDARAAFNSTVTPGFLKVGPFSSTLAVATPASTSTFTVAGSTAPARGTRIIIDPGTTTNSRSLVIATAQSGGNTSVTTATAMNGGAKPIGTAVRSSVVSDGVHFSPAGAIDAVPIVAARKSVIEAA